MKRMWLTALVGATLGVATAAALASTLPGEIVANAQQAAQTIAIRDVTTQGDTVSGVVANRSSRVVRNVGLLIRHTWFWKNERHPGDYSPGRAAFYTVPGPIPAGGSVPFEYRMHESAHAASDGYFSTTVEVMAFTEVESNQASR
jgi:hypothetical protein